MTHDCGCRTCKPAEDERRAVLEAEFREREMDFLRYMDRKARPILPDHETTRALIRVSVG